MTDVFCPLCGHEWRRHDPEDGCCDAHSNERLGVCECGRDMAWMHHKIAALSRAALAGVGEARPAEPPPRDAQNPDCDFVRRGDFNDCAHAGGGRGAKDGWCASCVGRLWEQLDALLTACTFVSSLPGDTGSPKPPSVEAWSAARAALGVEGRDE